jgi:hypothetical protein
MEAGEALSTAAQIAVTLAGFAGVVVVFRKESVHEWSAMNKFRLRLLLANSLLPLTFCMVGMILLSIKPAPVWIWRGASGFAAACMIPFAAIMMRRGLARTPIKITGSSRLIFYPLSALGTFGTLLEIYNAIKLNVFWAFYAPIIFQILTATVQFVRIILLPSEEES